MTAAKEAFLQTLVQGSYESHRLELTFRAIDARIKKLDRRGALMSPAERTLATNLKRARLAVLDRMSAITTRR